MMKISCVILTSDSNLKKGFCIRHALQSVLNQTYHNYEIILIDNSHDEVSSKMLETYLATNLFWNLISLHKPDVPLSRWAARNFWCNFVSWEVIVFLDDDAILLSNKSFSEIITYAQIADFWYGAKRWWTEENDWFQRNSEVLLEDIKNNGVLLNKHLQEAPESIRGRDIEWLQNFSFIWHFGFCKKKLFDKIWWFPDFKGCDFEDDYLMYQCFKMQGSFVSMEMLEVAHVTHALDKQNSSIVDYYTRLKSDWVFRFHPKNALNHKGEIIEKLGVWHVDYRILKAYFDYELMFKKKDNQKWMKLYSLQDYILLLQILQKAKNVDDFIQKSSSDFDSLIPVLESWISFHIVSFSKEWKIEDVLKFQYFPSMPLVEDFKLIPKVEYNQFPCDLDSRLKRVDLIRERFPFSDYLKIALLGDEDFVSPLLVQEIWLDVTVFECDEEITKQLSVIPFSNLKIIKRDIRQKDVLSKDRIKSFIIDPPYTKNGVLLFLFKGLQLLDFHWEVEEFYLIINTGMSQNFIEGLLKILSQCKIYVTEIRKNFSTYRLPENFSEKERANIFCKKHWLEDVNINYSSSSDLYILRSRKPDLDLLRGYISLDDIYNHDVF